MVAQQETIVVENNVKNLLMIKRKRSKRSRSRPLSPSALTISTDEAGSVVSQDWTATISEEEEDMARCLILLAQGSSNQLINNNNMNNNNNNNNNSTTKTSNKVMSYECKTCNRSFPSFQALGGHRTSHKKPKIIKPTSLTFDDNFPNQLVVDDGVFLTLQMANSPPPPPPPSNDIIIISENNSNSLISKVVKVHECGICGAEFSSGQALGGHMRRHRPIGTVKVERTAAVTVAEMGTTRNNLLALDLNLPAPEEEIKSSSKFVFGSNEKTLVFTASSLVDCHH